MEIIHDYTMNYIKENKIEKPKVFYGFVEEAVFVEVKKPSVDLPRQVAMGLRAEIIEDFIFKKCNVNKDIYLGTQKARIVKYRQMMQFFFAYYSDMTMELIGQVTGGKSHSLISNTVCNFTRKINKSPSLRKEIFLLDSQLYRNLGYQDSLIFAKNLEVIPHKRQGIKHTKIPPAK